MSFRNYRVDAIDIKNKQKGDPVFFNTAYSNCCLVSKKNSGKSNLIYHILRNIVGDDTKIYIFCSTANRDPIWIQLIKELEKKGNHVEVYDSLYGTIKKGKSVKNINILENLIDSWKEEEGEPEKKNKKKKDKQENQKGDGRSKRIKTPYDNTLTWDDLEEDHPARYIFSSQIGFSPQEEKPIEEKPKKKRKGRKLFPEKILILDDLSNEIKDPIVPAILKVNRHYKMVTLLSTQFPNDIKPSARSQFNQLFTWKGHSKAKVDVLRRICDLNLSEDEFYELYKEATEEPYSFLYCDIDGGKAYRNFTDLIYE